MKYRVDKKIIKLNSNEVTNPDQTIVETMTREEYEKKGSLQLHDKFLLDSIDNYQYCKADLLQQCTIGTIVIPDKTNLINKEICFGYYMDKKKLIFVDDTGMVERIIEEIEKIQIMDKTYVAHFFFEFLEYLVKDEVQYLQDYEVRMTEMEEELLIEKDAEIPSAILKCRKELLRLNAYYSQLVDMSETLKENYNNLLSDDDCNLFHLFSDRVDRLAGNAQTLREFALQILEMYQTQIDIRQNRIMQFLTVVTTIFMPLTLITGWYGMNFVNMPELKSDKGYLVVILVSVIIIVAEFLYFKKKKWFD